MESRFYDHDSRAIRLSQNQWPYSSYSEHRGTPACGAPASAVAARRPQRPRRIGHRGHLPAQAGYQVGRALAADTAIGRGLSQWMRLGPGRGPRAARGCGDDHACLAAAGGCSRTSRNWCNASPRIGGTRDAHSCRPRPCDASQKNCDRHGHDPGEVRARQTVLNTAFNKNIERASPKPSTWLGAVPAGALKGWRDFPGLGGCRRKRSGHRVRVAGDHRGQAIRHSGTSPRSEQSMIPEASRAHHRRTWRLRIN